jgi:hypothetical protein
MRTVVFRYPGTEFVHAWLYIRGVPWPYAYSLSQNTRGFIPDWLPVRMSLKADRGGWFRLKLASFQLAPGEYELHVCEATCYAEITGAVRVPFTTYRPLQRLLRRLHHDPTEGKMNEVVFGLPGLENVRVWLFQRDGTLGFNYARGDFTASDGGQSSPLVRNLNDNQFHFPIAWLGPARLPDGEYRLDAEGGSKTYFSVKWTSETEPVVVVQSQQFPQTKVLPKTISPEEVGGLTHEAQETLEKAAVAGSFLAIAKSKSKTAPKPELKPKSSGPMLEFEGKMKSVTEWAIERGLNPLTIYARLADGCTVEQALDVPTKSAHQVYQSARAGRAIELD